MARRLSFEEARAIAIERIGPQRRLHDNFTREKPYGWIFAFGSTKPDELLGGNAPFLVEREGGRVFRFGTGRPLELYIRDYERGFKYEVYDLRIRRVLDARRALNLLPALRMTYVIDEPAHGETRRISKYFDRAQLQGILATLPVTFTHQKFNPVADAFSKIDAARCLDYELSEHRPDAAGPPAPVPLAP